ncbi:MAG: hypothetical protein ACI8WT_001722 [Clostridium sp.]
MLTKEDLLQLIKKYELSKEELLKIRKYYFSNNCITDWFGCTGINRIFFTYEYIFDYKKWNEKTYKFKSKFQL